MVGPGPVIYLMALAQACGLWSSVALNLLNLSNLLNLLNQMNLLNLQTPNQEPTKSHSTQGFPGS